MGKYHFFLALLIITRITTSAQGIFEQEAKSAELIKFNGYARASATGLTDSYDYSAVFSEFSLQSKLDYGKAFLFADVRFRGGTQFNEVYSTVEMKELYAGLRTSKLEIFLGEQIVSWGRTDGFNPTNNITPNNYFFLSATPDDQKLPNFMLQMRYKITPQVSWDIIGIPFYKPSVYRYNLFELGQNVSFDSGTIPENNFENSSLASRVNVELSALGFSLSWFKGYDPFYGFEISSIDFTTGQPVITNSPSFYSKNSIGFDIEIPISSWIIRGEVAGNFTKDFKENMSIPNPNLAYVAAIEHSFFGLHTILQYIANYNFEFSELQVPVLSDPSNPLALMKYGEDFIRFESAQFNRKIFHQQEETNHAVSLTLSKSFAYDTWKAELTAYYNITSEEYFVRPKVTWLAGNGLEFSLGGSWMNGPNNSVFEHASALLNGAFLELKANF